ncbi:Ferredoxin 1 [Nymphon striatum]|nr:Ferredoxin 1 [Nymphon striatum]
MFCLIVAVLFGVIPEKEAFSGFGHAAVVTVAAVLILSQGLQNAGVVSLITEQMRRIKFTPLTLLATITLVVTILSAFMNNVGALALMLPITMVAAKEYNIPPARLLMPLAFGSILGGLTTLIGTPPNIIIAAYRAEVMGEEYGMFDFSPVGVPIAIVDPIEIKPLLDNHDFELLNTATHIYEEPDEHTAILMEGVIKQGSPIVGRDIRYLRRLSGRSVALVGLARDGESVVSRIRQQIFKVGDVLLIQGHEETIDEQFTQIGLLPLAPRVLELDRSRKVGLALSTFIGAIVLAMTNIVSLPIAFMLAVMVYVLTGIIRVREIYEQVDWADCVDVCPVECFHEGPEMLVIDPEECIDCALCVPECPIDAIFDEVDLPEDQQHFIKINADLTLQWPVIEGMKAAPE